MKRLWILLALMVLVLSLPLSASADLIYQPRDDFFKEHWDECNQYDKTHIANGSDGHVTIYKTPKDLQILGTIPNGEKVYIAWTYTAEDGIDWGCVKLWDEGIEGWIPMSPNYVASPPSGISPTTILIVAGAVAVISGGLLVVLKKKKT